MTVHDVDPAVEKVIASIGDEELAARYPDRTHFISAESPEQAEMASRALSDGDPVAIVYSDGHELLDPPRGNERRCGDAGDPDRVHPSPWAAQAG